MPRGGHGPIPPLPALRAAPELLEAARANCAARCRDRGRHNLADSYELGAQDQGWGIRHEVARLTMEAARG